MTCIGINLIFQNRTERQSSSPPCSVVRRPWW